MIYILSYHRGKRDPKVRVTTSGCSFVKKTVKLSHSRSIVLAISPIYSNDFYGGMVKWKTRKIQNLLVHCNCISSSLITATICCSNPMAEILALEASQCGFKSLLQYQKQEEPKWGKFLIISL